MKKYLFAPLLFVLLMFTGCYEDINVSKVKDVSYQELKGSTLKLSIVATVDNPNFYNVKIKNANMDLRLKDRVIGKVTQIEQVELKGRTEKDYKVSISIEIKDMLSNALTLSRTLMNDPSSLNLSGTVQAKALLYTKTFEVDNLSFQ